MVLGWMAAAALAVWGLSEQRRGRAHAAWLEERLGEQIERLNGHVARLEGEAAAALGQRDATLQLLRDVEARAAVTRQDRWELAREVLKPPPEDVRLALEALNRCLSADGHGSLKALGARAYDAHELKDVELLEVAGGLRSTFHAGARLALELDRANGSLVLRLHDGASVADGERVPFPPEGLALVLPQVYGPMWERELPYLVRARGDYPEAKPASRPSARQRQELSVWRERLNALLARADGALRWRVDRVGGVGEGGEFRDVVLLGYDGRRLTRSVEAAQLRVVADRERDVVALWCAGGTLREKGGEAPLDRAGWRLLVPGLGARSAHEMMLGFVAEAAR
jgi:hypothetical protein